MMRNLAFDRHGCVAIVEGHKLGYLGRYLGRSSEQESSIYRNRTSYESAPVVLQPKLKIDHLARKKLVFSYLDLDYI